VRVAADPVFLAPLVSNPGSDDVLEREGLKHGGGPLMIVALRRPLPPQAVLERLVEAIDHCAARYAARVAMLPLQPPGDSEASIEVIRRCRTAPVLLPGGYDFETTSALLARTSVIISMRLHALILAACFGVPFIALPFDPKISALTTELNYPLRELDARSDPVALVDEIWSRAAALKEHLSSAAATMQQRARLAFDWLQETVEGTVP
jgi:hypothetical protein